MAVAARAGLSRFVPAAGVMVSAALLTGCHVPGFAVQHPADKQGQQAATLWHATEFVALGVGVIGAAYPTWRALRLSPIEALRRE